MPNLSALNIYPIKACRGLSSQAAFVERRGLEHDRRFLIVNLEGLAVTQRDVPTLALVVPALTTRSLDISAPGMPVLSLPSAADGSVRQVTVWDDRQIKAIDQGEEAAAWFSSYTKIPVRLVRMPEDSRRKVDPRYATRPDDHVSFADGYPILIASQESLDDLNMRLDTPLPMNRFRPNLVVQGCQPFEEDSWKRIRIGEVEMTLVKPCARCEVTTHDQQTGLHGKEPLKTLATFRRKDGNKVMFGMNTIPLNEGRLRAGDPVEILA
jgi:uncharacterized protein YcbX